MLRQKNMGGVEFVAVIFTKPEKARSWQIDQCDVAYNPIIEDAAHANLTFFNRPPNDLLSNLADIMQELGVCPADNLEQLPDANGGRPF